MAFAFGDSYLKLPPISKESSVEIDGENSKRGSGIVRDKHGLVRLPPIVRLESLRSPSSASRLRKEAKTATTESESELSTLGAPLKISHKMESLRHGNSNKHKKYTEKREDETKLIKEPTVMETNEYEARFFDGEDASRGKQKASRARSNNLLNEAADEDFIPLFKDSVIRRRGSSILQTSGKLTRSHRLAKSSPELSNRKINSRLRADGTVRDSTVSPFAAGLRPSSRSRFSKPRLSVHDIDGSVLSHLQNTSKIDEKPKEYGKRRNHSKHRWRNDLGNQPQSTPSSPVCSESANKEIKQKGRKSLNDITDAQQFNDRRRPSLTPKKQNLIQESEVGEVLQIEGKTCPQNEREVRRDRAHTECHIDTLHPPQQDEKRHSLYDLQQFLTLLQEENLKRKASSTASTPRNTSATSNASDKNINASVYDLREFLMLAAAEASNATAGQQKKKMNTSSHLLLPGQEREHAHSERKGSVYDLMEFLSLGNDGETESGSPSENSSRATSPRILFSPRDVSGSNDLLSVAKNAEEGRRSSTYDLMEFLSLPRSGGSSRSDSGQSSPASHGDGPSGAESEESEFGRRKRENRSLSVYDLAEFLSMTSSIPPLVRVTPSNEEQAETSAELGGAAKIASQKPRESVYDLREILNVMQHEHERKRESTYNLQEILSHYQREADETSQLASVPSNSHEKNTLASPSPPMTASSGYSTASDSLPSTTSAKHLDTKPPNRQMSVYDLREFLSLYAAQQGQPNQQQLPSAMLRRKFSGVSQSGVSIHVTDESNRSIDSEVFEDVFLPVPGAEAGLSEQSRKRNSVYDLREFLSILNADDSPLRRRLSSVSSASSKSSESESESNPCTSSLKSDAHSAAANENSAGSRPQLSPRQDSGGSVSLYDLGEFLSLLNTDESPLRRRLSSASDIMAAQSDIQVRTPVLSRTDSEKGLYSLEEILTVMNDLEQNRISESASEDLGADSGEEISIPVPTLHPKTDKTNTQSFASRKRLGSLNSVHETSETKINHSNSL